MPKNPLPRQVHILFLMLIMISSACLPIDSTKDRATGQVNYSSEGYVAGNNQIDFRYNFGLLTNKEQSMLDQLSTAYYSNREDLKSGEQLGQYLVQMKQYSSATEVFQEILQINPNNVFYHRWLGQTYFVMKEMEKAKFHLNKAKNLLSTTSNVKDNLSIQWKDQPHYYKLHYNVYYLLGVVYYASHNYDKSITAFKKAYELSNVVNLKVITSNWLYMAYCRAGNCDKAKSFLSISSAITSLKSAQVHLKSLQIYNQKSDPNKIALGVKKRYFQDEDFAVLLYAIGNYHLYNQDYSSARLVFKRAIDEAEPYAIGTILAQQDLILIEENLLH